MLMIKQNRIENPKRYRSSFWSMLMGFALFFFSISPANAAFVRGDVNDDTAIDVSDAVSIVNYIFSAPEERPCEDAADANDDGSVNVTDIVYIVYYIFGTGNPPPEPFAVRGEDPTADALGCHRAPEASNECLINNGSCDPLTNCVDTPLSFECGDCPEGYTGNGYEGCVDVDECTTEEHLCDELTECLNTDGGFECSACPQGYDGNGQDECVLSIQTWNLVFSAQEPIADMDVEAKETDDGGTIIIGDKLIKTNAFGEVEWIDTEESGRSVLPADDGGYVILGQSPDYFRKITADGDLDWWKRFYRNSHGNFIQPTSDGGYIFVGGKTITRSTGGCTPAPGEVFCRPPSSSRRYIQITKTNEAGYSEKISHHVRNIRPNYEEPGVVIEASDGGYLVATFDIHLRENGSQQAWLHLLKVSPSLYDDDRDWVRGWGSTALGGEAWSGKNIYPKFVQATEDGGYVIVGVIGQNSFILKTDVLGYKQWIHIFDESWADNDTEIFYNDLQYVQQTADGGYIATGTSQLTSESSKNAWLIKVDDEGHPVWEQTFGGALDDRARTVQQTSDGGYLIAGTTASFGSAEKNLWAIKTDNFGNAPALPIVEDNEDDEEDDDENDQGGGTTPTQYCYDSSHLMVGQSRIVCRGGCDYGDTTTPAHCRNGTYSCDTNAQCHVHSQFSYCGGGRCLR